MKSFKQLREECGCKDKERKTKSKKTVEVMPQVKDGSGMKMGVKEEALNEKSVSKAQQKFMGMVRAAQKGDCLLYTSPSPRDQRGSRMPSSA